MKVCASCGASLPDGAAFCISCFRVISYCDFHWSVPSFLSGHLGSGESKLKNPFRLYTKAGRLSRDSQK